MFFIFPRRWKIVIRGGIDGYSCLITFLKASTDNRAQTVLRYFTAAVDQYHVRSRVRTDHGGENGGVWQFMERARGENHGSYIAGRSTHNQRIERIWRDVYQQVVAEFSRVLPALEVDGRLDPINDLDIFCPHLVFLPS